MHEVHSDRETGPCKQSINIKNIKIKERNLNQRRDGLIMRPSIWASPIRDV